MILDCAACGARYLLAERAIGPEGRQVRCARCGVSWFAGPTAYELMRPVASLPPGREAMHRAPPPPAPRSDPKWAAIREGGRFPSRWMGRPSRSGEMMFRPRRTPVSVLNWLAASCCAVLLLASGAAVAWANGATSAVPWAGPYRGSSAIGAETPPLQIALLSRPSLKRIASGSTLFAVSGEIRNPTARRIPVPDVIADLRNDRGMPMYSWTIHMPRSMLAAHESIDFDTSQLDVPDDIKSIRLSFIPRMTAGHAS